MIKHTDPYNISQIFSNEKVVFYYIPKYQREYTWGQKEWDLLFNDIIENENGYFLGSIIGVDISNSAMNDAKLEIIDGQQRITSLSILLTALYSKLIKFKEELDEDGITDINNIKRELIARKNGINIPRLTPQIQHYNKDDYFSLLNENELIGDCEKRNNAGNRRIYKAFYHFSRLIDKYIQEIKNEENSANEQNILFELVNKFNSAVVVLIEVETHKDAYMLFESLNNRGVPLSAIDLIKNMLISISDNDGKSEETYEKWKKIINYLSEDYAVQERFFRQYYNAFREELNQPFPVSGKTKYKLGYLATKTTILDIYESLIKYNYNKFLDEIMKEASNYSILINNANEDNYIYELEKPLLNLDRISGAPSYILLLYLLSKKEKLEISNEIIAKVVNDLIIFFVRRNITDYPNTRNLTKIFMDIISNIEMLKGEDVYNKVLKMLQENSSDDKTFENKLRGDVYLNNPEATRFLLCYYEEKYDTKEKTADLWGRDRNNKYIWTIEHIFPEGDNIPSEWVKMIANGDKELAQNYLDLYTHKIGNLTISGYNQNLSNYSFEIKKNRKDQKGNYIGYRNGLKINEVIVNKDEWTVEDIKNRTDKLVKVFLEDFKI